MVEQGESIDLEINISGNTAPGEISEFRFEPGLLAKEEKLVRGILRPFLEKPAVVKSREMMKALLMATCRFRYVGLKAELEGDGVMITWTLLPWSGGALAEDLEMKPLWSALKVGRALERFCADPKDFNFGVMKKAKRGSILNYQIVSVDGALQIESNHRDESGQGQRRQLVVPDKVLKNATVSAFFKVQANRDADAKKGFSTNFGMGAQTSIDDENSRLKLVFEPLAMVRFVKDPAFTYKKTGNVRRWERAGLVFEAELTESGALRSFVVEQTDAERSIRWVLNAESEKKAVAAKASTLKEGSDLLLKEVGIVSALFGKEDTNVGEFVRKGGLKRLSGVLGEGLESLALLIDQKNSPRNFRIPPPAGGMMGGAMLSSLLSVNQLLDNNLPAKHPWRGAVREFCGFFLMRGERAVYQKFARLVADEDSSFLKMLLVRKAVVKMMKMDEKRSAKLILDRFDRSEWEDELKNLRAVVDHWIKETPLTQEAVEDFRGAWKRLGVDFREEAVFEELREGLREEMRD